MLNVKILKLHKIKFLKVRQSQIMLLGGDLLLYIHLQHLRCSAYRHLLLQSQTYFDQYIDSTPVLL